MNKVKYIDNITTYGIDDMETLEDIGIGLIPYDDTVARSMHSIIDDTKEAIDMPVSYELSLTDDMRILRESAEIKYIEIINLNKHAWYDVFKKGDLGL